MHWNWDHLQERCYLHIKYEDIEHEPVKISKWKFFSMWVLSKFPAKCPNSIFVIHEEFRISKQNYWILKITCLCTWKNTKNKINKIYHKHTGFSINNKLLTDIQELRFLWMLEHRWWYKDRSLVMLQWPPQTSLCSTRKLKCY